MEPAYTVPLDARELALLGELTVILGQIDELMIRTVQRLLSVQRDVANKIMGSTKFADNGKIWLTVIMERVSDPDILWLVNIANREFEPLSAARNDFIHAWFYAASGYFGTYFGNWFGRYFGRPFATARRVKRDQERPIRDLEPTRDRAARLSCLIAHIDHLIEGKPALTSPWRSRLAPTLPPR
jgi:hypothetical protein